MPDQIPHIVEQISALLAETRKLREATEHVVPSVEREARRGLWTRVLVGIMALVMVGLAALGLQLYGLTQAQERTTQRALCPVFSLLVGGYNPESRMAGPDRDAYNLQFSLFRDAYLELQCVGGFVPPPIRR